MALQSLRGLFKTPGLCLTVIAVLSLGIGANAALFSIIDRTVLHLFPFRELDRIVEVTGLAANGRESGPSAVELELWQSRVPSFEQTAMWRWQNLTLTGMPDPENLFTLETSPKLFDLLGVRPALGRLFRVEEHDASAAPVALISHKL
jgi:hypothetical protein